LLHANRANTNSGAVSNQSEIARRARIPKNAKKTKTFFTMNYRKR